MDAALHPQTVLAYAMNGPELPLDHGAPLRLKVPRQGLWIIANFASRSPGLKIRVPTKPFIRLLNSPVFSDLNKASAALMELTGSRDPVLLASIREQAMASLVEMAKFKSEGHAIPALTILGRIAGWFEEDIQSVFVRGQRENLINAALERR